MPRTKLIVSKKFPYHLTNRSNNKDFFYLDMNILWKIFLEIFYQMNEMYEIRIHNFVLMDNHYHLIADFPRSNVSECSTYLHREVAKRSNKYCKRINHFWGSRYKWSLLAKEQYYWNSIKYIFRNPVDAGLVNSVEDYKYSSLNCREEIFKVVNLFSKKRNPIELNREWLNEKYTSKQYDAIRLALRKANFSFPNDENKKKVEFNIAHPQKVLGT